MEVLFTMVGHNVATLKLGSEFLGAYSVLEETGEAMVAPSVCSNGGSPNMDVLSGDVEPKAVLQAYYAAHDSFICAYMGTYVEVKPEDLPDVDLCMLKYKKGQWTVGGQCISPKSDLNGRFGSPGACFPYSPVWFKPKLTRSLRSLFVENGGYAAEQGGYYWAVFPVESTDDSDMLCALQYADLANALGVRYCAVKCLNLANVPVIMYCLGDVTQMSESDIKITTSGVSYASVWDKLSTVQRQDFLSLLMYDAMMGSYRRKADELIFCQGRPVGFVNNTHCIYSLSTDAVKHTPSKLARANMLLFSHFVGDDGKSVEIGDCKAALTGVANKSVFRKAAVNGYASEIADLLYERYVALFNAEPHFESMAYNIEH